MFGWRTNGLHLRVDIWAFLFPLNSFFGRGSNAKAAHRLCSKSWDLSFQSLPREIAPCHLGRRVWRADRYCQGRAHSGKSGLPDLLKNDRLALLVLASFGLRPTFTSHAYSRLESFRSCATCSIRRAASASETATCSAQSGAGVEGAFSLASSASSSRTRLFASAHSSARAIAAMTTRRWLPILPKRCRSAEILASTNCARSPRRTSSPSSQATR